MKFEPFRIFKTVSDFDTYKDVEQASTPYKTRDWGHNLFSWTCNVILPPESSKHSKINFDIQRRKQSEPFFQADTFLKRKLAVILQTSVTLRKSIA